MGVSRALRSTAWGLDFPGAVASGYPPTQAWTNAQGQRATVTLPAGKGDSADPPKTMVLGPNGGSEGYARDDALPGCFRRSSGFLLRRLRAGQRLDTVRPLENPLCRASEGEKRLRTALCLATALCVYATSILNKQN